MAAMGRFAIAFSAALALLAGSAAQAKSSPPVIGYVAAFKGLDRIVDEADFSRYTHVDLAFVNPGRDGAISVDGALACAPDGKGGANVSPASLRRLVETAHRAGAKVLVSVGGGVIPPCSGDWAQLLQPQTRGKIVAGLVALIDEYGFDGLDIDLEGDLMTRIDKARNYTPFVAALSAQLRARGKLLTCATASYEGGMVPDSSLPFFDLVGIMSYDAIGPSWGEAGSEHSTYAQAERDLRLWIGKGVPVDKLALGVPFYGYGFGRYRRNYAFDEIAAQFGRAARRGDVVGRLCAGCDYITYNGIETLRRKAELAGAWGAGVMVWEIDQDTPDHRLIRSLRKALQNGRARARRVAR
jgi:GH18 family chitinase